MYEYISTRLSHWLVPTSLTVDHSDIFRQAKPLGPRKRRPNLGDDSQHSLKLAGSINIMIILDDISHHAIQ